ncbi:c-type cytochrome [Methylonatrum kenyense]|uniref:c-type cytochrome n=1 Tax=Methylonatrum kenyense TaxID=455253 RepID=UPI0020C02802|nr:c-type cytochrome [Methylonatrum kenyense]MCK8515981.1 c-type cytochrome [Methylonatrum kenyense]
MRSVFGVIGGAMLAMGAAQAEYDIPKVTEIDEVTRGEGQSIVESACVRCHGAGVMGAQGPGAPGWQHLVDARGFEALTRNVIRGRGAMPARGGASDASDAQIAAAVRYFLESSDVDLEAVEH